MNDINQLKDEISSAKASIKAAGEKKYQAERAAEKEYWNTVSPINQKLEEITEKYKDLAIELADQARISPYSRSGHQLDPTEAQATPEGIALTWDAEEHYNCVYHTVSWAEIFEAESKQIN